MIRIYLLEYVSRGTKLRLVRAQPINNMNKFMLCIRFVNLNRESQLDQTRRIDPVIEERDTYLELMHNRAPKCIDQKIDAHAHSAQIRVRAQPWSHKCTANMNMLLFVV